VGPAGLHAADRAGRANAGLFNIVVWPGERALAVGDYAVELSGTTWSLVPKPADAGQLYGIWAPTPNDVWASGVGGGLYRNTTGSFASADAWQVIDSGVPNTNVSAVFTTSASHAFWGSGGGGLWESVDGGVTRIAGDSTFAIHGLSDDDIWTVGTGSLLHRRLQGQLFDDFWPPPDHELFIQGVSLLPGGAAWAAGDQHAVYTRDGGTWSRVRIAGDLNFAWFYDIWAAPDGTVVAVGEQPMPVAYWDAAPSRCRRSARSTRRPRWRACGAARATTSGRSAARSTSRASTARCGRSRCSRSARSTRTSRRRGAPARQTCGSWEQLLDKRRRCRNDC